MRRKTTAGPPVGARAAARELGLSRIDVGEHSQFDRRDRLGRLGRFVLDHALVLRRDGGY
jgi:hypothetical protein